MARAVMIRFRAAVGNTDVPLTDPGLPDHQMRAYDTTEDRKPGLSARKIAKIHVALPLFLCPVSASGSISYMINSIDMQVSQYKQLITPPVSAHL